METNPALANELSNQRDSLDSGLIILNKNQDLA